MEDTKKQVTDIKTYDFEKSRKFSATNIKFLDFLADEYCKISNLQLQHELKHQDLKFKSNNSEQELLSNFVEKTAYDTVLIDFTIGRARNMIAKIDKICALTFVECLLGGDGSIHNEKRDITDIDIAILRYLNETLFRKLSSDTANQAPVSIKEVYTNTAQFRTPLQISENLFISNIDITLRNEKVGELSICIPLSSIEGIISELISRSKGELEKSQKEKDDALENENKVINALYENKVTFDVVAELGKTTITVGELLELDKDDVLILNRKINESIDILVGESLAYKAQPGISGLKKAVIIEDLAEKGETNNDGEKNN